MQKIVYTIPLEDKEIELDWLYDQHIFPAIQVYYDWKLEKEKIRIGVIVGNEAALSIKLRHKLDLQTNYGKK
jgi:hypothetical protein